MTPRLFANLAAAAVVSASVAVLFYANQEEWSSADVSGQAFIPAMANQAKNIQEVELRQGSQKLTFELSDEKWKIRERGNYPAKTDSLRKLLVGLAKAKLIEPKTSKPDRHNLLELEDPSAKDAKSKGVILRDKSGTVIADVLIGKKLWGAFGAGKSGTYVRRADENQTWLADSDLEVDLGLKGWVEQKIFSAETGDISKVTLNHPGEEKMVIVPVAEGKPAFKITDLPENSELKSQAMVDAIPQSFQLIELEDIREPEKPSGETETSVATVEMKDGLTVTFMLSKEGADYWISIAAKGSGEAKKKAEELNNRVGNLEYKIPAWKASQIFRRRTELYRTS